MKLTETLRKISVMILGVFLCLVAIEAVLQALGMVYSLQKSHRNKAGKDGGEVYKILCLGDSMTDEQYPWQLEEVLNARHVGVKFKVIDEGHGGTNSDFILINLKKYLEEYYPDMVVTMTGVTDIGKDLVVFEYGSAPWYTALRSYKLIKILKFYVKAKMIEINNKRIKAPDDPAIDRRNRSNVASDPIRSVINTVKDMRNKDADAYIAEGESYMGQDKYEEAEKMFRKVIEINFKDDRAYEEIGRLCTKQRKYKEAEKIYRKAIEINPQNDDAYVGLGDLYSVQLRFKEAEEIYQKAIEIDPKIAKAYIGLGNSYRDQKKYKQAEEIYQKAIERDPKDVNACIELGISYEEQKKYNQAEKIFQKASEINPEDDRSYAWIGQLRLEQKKYKQAEEIYQKAIEIIPNSERVYLRMGRLYKQLGNYKKAEEMFLKTIKVNPKHYKTYAELGHLYRTQGKYKEAMFLKTIENDQRQNVQEVENISLRYLEKDDSMNSSAYYGQKIKYNYGKLREILGQRKIKLVCVEYPTRSILPLKSMLAPDDGVIFVDNEKSFKDGVAREGYDAYFIDETHGTWGHCTYKGNRLLAENIADAIIKGAFQH